MSLDDLINEVEREGSIVAVAFLTDTYSFTSEKYKAICMLEEPLKDNGYRVVHRLSIHAMGTSYTVYPYSRLYHLYRKVRQIFIHNLEK